ncbi:hypothetical protein BCV70DRAFT_189331 [Testicularia cyperi]|uniref:FHF complex subunit HOOK-interacting protein C-terminal domain-containing protein n=1 Tax=Testicularia cyperi TaxID=1882483 RepID=A0A317XTQ6_9BASI|nr:hypothetical protein BCV70DRAFT_189331 [Testicularia cyperi]
MEYLSRLSGLVATPAKAAGIRTGPKLHKKPSLHPVGSVDVFHADWEVVKSELQRPDERALFFGVARSDLPRRLQRIVDALVFESNRSNDGLTGPCMEYLLKYDILTELVDLSAEDRPKGIKGETIRTLTNLIILLDERFLSRRAVHKPISQLIQLCLDEDAARFQLDDDLNDINDVQTSTADPDYNEDLVDLMCHIASRIRNTPDLLRIFFSDEPIDDRDFHQDVRSLRDGSIIVRQELMIPVFSHNAGTVASAQQDNEAEATQSPDRPASPAGSVDSTATVQPTRNGNGSGHTTNSTPAEQRNNQTHSLKRRLRFPLFSYLLKFIHRESRIGELARAGLLFLISLEANKPATAQTDGTDRKTTKGRGSARSKIERRVSFEADDIRRSLAVFIAHSDFADVLGAGLGAAYGLLPSRVRPSRRYDPTAVAASSSASSQGLAKDAVITLGSGSAAGDSGSMADTSSYASSSFNEGLASATPSDDPELQAQLRLVVDLIDFCQDVVDSLLLAARQPEDAATTASVGPSPSKSPSLTPSSSSSSFDPTSHLDPTIRKLASAIAVAIRDTFIRNVVYPSLMESSDFDGSATAVLSYLDVVAIVLRDGHILTEVVLDFLLATDGDRTETGQYHLGLPVDDADRYSLKDLVLDNLDSSKRPTTRIAALKLAQSLITSHGRRANGGLLALPPRRRGPSTSASQADLWSAPVGVAPDISMKTLTTRVDLHLRELDQYGALLSGFQSASSGEKLQASLSPYLLDAEQNLRSDSTFSLALDGRDSNSGGLANSSNGSSALSASRIRLVPSDPFVQNLFQSMAELFLHPSEVNLAVTGVLASLALCPIRSLEGWLTYDYASISTSGEEEQPALLQLLSSLVEQVEHYRVAVPDFDRYMAERRRGLVLTDDITEALTQTVTAKRQPPPSLSLPSISKAKTPTRTIHTDQQIRTSQREFGIVKDQRALLSTESNPAASPATTTDTGGAAAEPRQSALARLFGGRPTRVLSKDQSPTPNLSTHPHPQQISPASASAGMRKISSSTINPYSEHYSLTRAVWVRARPATGAFDWRPPPTSTSTSSSSESLVTLDSVLDNSILLEEFTKELIAVIHVRRSWGFDPVLF